MRLGGRLQILRERMGPLWWHTAILLVVGRLGDVVNLYTGFFFLPGALSVGDLGAVDPINRLAVFGAVPISVLSIVAAKYLSAYHAVGAYGKIRCFFGDLRKVALVCSLLMVAFISASYPGLRLRLRLDSPYVFPALCGFAVAACWQPMIAMMIQGTQRFRTVTFLSVADPLLRLGICVVAVPRLGLTGYLVAAIAGAGLHYVTGRRVLRRFLGATADWSSYRGDWPDMARYAAPVAVYVGACSLQAFVEPFTVKHFLAPEDAAAFYMTWRYADMPTLLLSVLNFVLLPVVSFRHEQGGGTQAYLRQALTAALAVCLVGALVMGLTAPWVFGLRAAWRPFVPYADRVWQLCVILSIQTLMMVFATHQMACRRFGFVWTVALVAVLESAVLYGSFVWSAFQHFLPADWWDTVNEWPPRDFDYVIHVMMGFRLLLAALLIPTVIRALRGQAEDGVWAEQKKTAREMA